MHAGQSESGCMGPNEHSAPLLQRAALADLAAAQRFLAQARQLHTFLLAAPAEQSGSNLVPTSCDRWHGYRRRLCDGLRRATLP